MKEEYVEKQRRQFTTVTMDRKVHNALRIYCVTHGVKNYTVVNEALREYFKAHPLKATR